MDPLSAQLWPWAPSHPSLLTPASSPQWGVRSTGFLSPQPRKAPPSPAPSLSCPFVLFYKVTFFITLIF